MAINKNHEFGEVGEVKCSIVEKEASKERVAFLKELLELNGFNVVIGASPPLKTAAPKPVAEGELAPVVEDTPPLPETFTVGVTNVSFNPTNAIFGRQLRTKNGHVVTLAFWEQKETESRDEVPYFEK